MNSYGSSYVYVSLNSQLFNFLVFSFIKCYTFHSSYCSYLLAHPLFFRCELKKKSVIYLHVCVVEKNHTEAIVKTKDSCKSWISVAICIFWKIFQRYLALSYIDIKHKFSMWIRLCDFNPLFISITIKWMKQVGIGS